MAFAEVSPFDASTGLLALRSLGCVTEEAIWLAVFGDLGSLPSDSTTDIDADDGNFRVRFL